MQLHLGYPINRVPALVDHLSLGRVPGGVLQVFAGHALESASVVARHQANKGIDSQLRKVVVSPGLFHRTQGVGKRVGK